MFYFKCSWFRQFIRAIYIFQNEITDSIFSKRFHSGFLYPCSFFIWFGLFWDFYLIKAYLHSDLDLFFSIFRFWHLFYLFLWAADRIASTGIWEPQYLSDCVSWTFYKNHSGCFYHQYFQVLNVDAFRCRYSDVDTFYIYLIDGTRD